MGHLPCQREEEAFSEIVDLENAKTCSVLKKFPYWMRGAVGGSLGSTPVVCGGDWIDKCYTYIKNQSTIEGYGNSGNGSETNYTPYAKDSSTSGRIAWIHFFETSLIMKIFKNDNNFICRTSKNVTFPNIWNVWLKN